MFIIIYMSYTNACFFYIVMIYLCSSIAILSLSLSLSDERPLVSGSTPGFPCSLLPPAALEVHLVFP